MVAVSAALLHWCLRKANGNVVTVTGVFGVLGMADKGLRLCYHDAQLATLASHSVLLGAEPFRLCDAGKVFFDLGVMGAQ